MAQPVSSPEPRHSIRSIRRNRRKSVVDLSLVTVEMDPAGFGLMLDVSEDGVGVQVMNKIKPGTDVQIKFDLPDSAVRVEASGVVTWYDGEGRVGLCFKQLKDEMLAALKKWIATLPEAHTDEIRTSAPSVNQSSANSLLMEQVRVIQTQIAASKLNVDLVLQFLVERVVELTRSTGGAIALGTSEEMICRASTGLAPEVGVKISSDSALTAECLRTSKTIRCNDTETDSRVDREICRRLDLRSLLILPVLYEGKIRGVLEVFAPVPNAFSDQHLAMLQQLADFTSQIVYAPKASPEPAKKIEAPTVAPAQAKVNEVAAGPAPTKAPEMKAAAPAPGKVPESMPAAPSPKPAVAPVIAAEAKPVVPAAPVAAAPPKPVARVEEAPAPPRKPSGRIKRASHANAAAATAPAFEKEEPSNLAESLLTPEELELVPKQEPGYRKIIIPLASLLVLLVVLGFWFKSRTARQTPNARVGPIVTKNQTLPTPRTEPMTVTPETASQVVTPEPPTSAKKEATPAGTSSKKSTKAAPEDEVTDSVRPAPINLASGTGSFRSSTKDDSPVDAVPMTGAAGSSNLASLNLPGTTDKPELMPMEIGAKGGYPVHQVKPLYPTSAREKRVEGNVVLAVRVLKNGMVGNIRRVSGNPILANAATDAVRRWRYEPYTINGEAQALDTTITVQFRLPNR